MLMFGVIGYVFKKLELPAGAAGAGAGARRHGRELVPAGDADLAGRSEDLLVELRWSAGIVTLALLMLFWPAISALLGRLRGKKPGEDDGLVETVAID